MAKRSKKTTTTKQIKRWQVVTVIIAILLSTIIGSVAYVNHQSNLEKERSFQADKARFAVIEQDVEAIKAELDPTLRPGDTATIDKSCAYTSAKFEKGTLMCAITLEIDYANKSADNIELIRDLVIKTGKFNGLPPSLSTYRDVASGSTKSETYVYRTNSKSDFCTVSQRDYGLAAYSVVCGEQVSGPVYPIRD